MKTFWKYFSIILLLLIGLCMLGILYLFFVPNSSIFGLRYLSLNETIYSDRYTAESFNKVTVNSHAYEVYVEPSDSENIIVSLYVNSLGFTLVDNSNYAIDTDIDGSELVFDITEPTGALVRNDSHITVMIPADTSIALELNNDSANTYIDHSSLNITELSYTTKSGDFEFTSGSVSGAMDLDIGKADFKIGAEVVTNNNSVTIDSTTGLFEAQPNLGDIVVLSSDRAVFRLINCNSFYMNDNDAGGSIDISQVQRVEIISSDTNITLGEVANDTSIENAIRIELTKTGKIDIQTTHQQATLITNDGNINVVTALDIINPSTQDGNVTIGTSKALVNFQSDYGNLDVSYSLDTDADRRLIARTNNGRLTIRNVDNVAITVNGNGRVDVEMNAVLGNNIITAKSGSVRVIMPDSAEYKLHTYTESGEVNVNLLEISAGGGYKDKEKTTYINSATDSSPSMDISTTTGSLYVRDRTLEDAGY